MHITRHISLASSHRICWKDNLQENHAINGQDHGNLNSKEKGNNTIH